MLWGYRTCNYEENTEEVLAYSEEEAMYKVMQKNPGGLHFEVEN